MEILTLIIFLILTPQCKAEDESQSTEQPRQAEEIPQIGENCNVLYATIESAKHGNTLSCSNVERAVKNSMNRHCSMTLSQYITLQRAIEKCPDEEYALRIIIYNAVTVEPVPTDECDKLVSLFTQNDWEDNNFDDIGYGHGGTASKVNTMGISFFVSLVLCGCFLALWN